MVAIATISPNIASPEGEGFAPSPEETLRLGNPRLQSEETSVPASIFSETELARLASFPEEIPSDELIRAFTLTGADRDLTDKNLSA